VRFTVVIEPPQTVGTVLVVRVAAFS